MKLCLNAQLKVGPRNFHFYFFCFQTFATCAIFALTLPRGSTSLIAILGAQLERRNARTPLALAGINAEDVALQFKLINVLVLLASLVKTF